MGPAPSRFFGAGALARRRAEARAVHNVVPVMEGRRS